MRAILRASLAARRRERPTAAGEVVRLEASRFRVHGHCSRRIGVGPELSYTDHRSGEGQCVIKASRAHRIVWRHRSERTKGRGAMAISRRDFLSALAVASAAAPSLTLARSLAPFADDADRVVFKHG